MVISDLIQFQIKSNYPIIVILIFHTLMYPYLFQTSEPSNVFVVMQFENICNKKNNEIADIRSLLIILTVMNF